MMKFYLLTIVMTLSLTYVEGQTIFDMDMDHNFELPENPRARRHIDPFLEFAGEFIMNLIFGKLILSLVFFQARMYPSSVSFVIKVVFN